MLAAHASFLMAESIVGKHSNRQPTTIFGSWAHKSYCDSGAKMNTPNSQISNNQTPPFRCKTVCPICRRVDNHCRWCLPTLIGSGASLPYGHTKTSAKPQSDNHWFITKQCLWYANVKERTNHQLESPWNYWNIFLVAISRLNYHALRTIPFSILFDWDRIINGWSRVDLSMRLSLS